MRCLAAGRKFPVTCSLKDLVLGLPNNEDPVLFLVGKGAQNAVTTPGQRPRPDATPVPRLVTVTDILGRLLGSIP